MQQSDLFKAGMRRLAASVSLITTLDAAGARHGLIATSVASVSLDPPSLLVCVNRSASPHDRLETSGVFCVNILGQDGAEIATRFSSPDLRESRFAEGEWIALATGAPALASATASFDCRVAHRLLKGSHTIFIGDVVAVRLAETPAPPLIYFGGGYAELKPRSA